MTESSSPPTSGIIQSQSDDNRGDSVMSIADRLSRSLTLNESMNSATHGPSQTGSGSYSEESTDLTIYELPEADTQKSSEESLSLVTDETSEPDSISDIVYGTCEVIPENIFETIGWPFMMDGMWFNVCFRPFLPFYQAGLPNRVRDLPNGSTVLYLNIPDQFESPATLKYLGFQASAIPVIWAQYQAIVRAGYYRPYNVWDFVKNVVIGPYPQDSYGPSNQGWSDAVVGMQLDERFVVLLGERWFNSPPSRHGGLKLNTLSIMEQRWDLLYKMEEYAIADPLPPWI